jgi:hypothetical protein
MAEVRDAIRVRHYSIRTEQVYTHWVRRFIRFHGNRPPRDMGPSQVRTFLTYLAVDRDVAAATQNQALNALVFLYKRVLEQPLGDIDGVPPGVPYREAARRAFGLGDWPRARWALRDILARGLSAIRVGAAAG